MPTILDLIVGRLARRLDGPTVAFTDSDAPASSASDAAAGPGLAVPGPAAADRAPGSNPGGVGAASTDRLEGGQGVGFPQAHTSPRPGAGHVADNCIFWLDDPAHECLNSYGEPIRPGQACYHSARIESLRTYTDRRPNSWLTQIVATDIPQEVTR